jgi:IS5 family transposase
VERMLWIYFLQQWFNLSDPALENALYDSRAMRGFVGIDPGREPVPDDTKVCASAICSKRTTWASSHSQRCCGMLTANGLKIATGTILFGWRSVKVRRDATRKL